MSEIDNEAMGYDLKISDMMQKSNRLAWSIAFFSLLFGAVAIFSYIYNPLVKTIPYVIKIDGDGIPSLMTSIGEKKLETQEVVDRYFIKEYVVKREQYFWNLLEKDYLFVQLLSSPSIVKQYTQIYEGENARDKRLGKNAEVDINIKSIVLGVNASRKNATIRIEKIIKVNNQTKKIKKEVITLVYEFNGGLKMTEKERLKNPLGFRAITYKIDKEIE